MKSIKYDLPFLALRDVVVFPGNVTTLFVGREKSINALNHAMSGNKKILLGAQIDGTLDDPDYEDIFDVVTMATILQLIKLPDGTLKVLVEGINRCQKVKPINEKQFMKFQVNVIEPISLNANDEKNLIHFIKSQKCSHGN